MRAIVLIVASGTLRIWDPTGHALEPVLRIISVENKAPNNMTSEARKLHTPSLAFVTPVNGCGSLI
jgi:hypothetical protein